MRTMIYAGVALVALALPARANPNCLEIGRIWGWKALDNKTLIAEDELHEKFKLGLMGYCPKLPFKLDLGFKSVGAINGLDCVARGDEVITRDITGGYNCPIMSITPYTPAMEKADQSAAAATAGPAN